MNSNEEIEKWNLNRRKNYPSKFKREENKTLLLEKDEEISKKKQLSLLEILLRKKIKSNECT